MAEDAAEPGSRKGPQKIEGPVGVAFANRLFYWENFDAAGRSALHRQTVKILENVSYGCDATIGAPKLGSACISFPTSHSPLPVSEILSPELLMKPAPEPLYPCPTARPYRGVLMWGIVGPACAAAR